MKKFMLDCRFNFKAFAKNVRKKATKFVLRAAQTLDILMFLKSFT